MQNEPDVLDNLLAFQRMCDQLAASESVIDCNFGKPKMGCFPAFCH